MRNQRVVVCRSSKRGLHVDANLSRSSTVNRKDRTNNNSVSDSPDSDSPHRRDEASEPPTYQTEAPRTVNTSDGSHPRGESDRSYRVGYGRPPVKSQFKKGHKGYTRRKTAKPAPKDLREAIFDQLNQDVTVVEKGKRRKMSGFEVAARSFAQDFMRGDPRARSQLLQHLVRDASSSAVKGGGWRPVCREGRLLRSSANSCWIYRGKPGS